MKKTLYFTAKTLFVFSIALEASAFVASRPNLHVGMQEGENCGMQSRNGQASQLGEISQMLHQAAWYQDRDNSMTAVSTEEGVGAAMATFWSLNGFTQGVQVCPGVYLASAHGVLDDPNKARSEGRDLREPMSSFMTAVAYPMGPSNGMNVSSNSQFISPRLRDPSTWSDPTTDYVFVTVDNPLRPNNFVRPVRGSDQRLVEASNSGEMNVHLYRPQTRFNTDSKGTPDFNAETWASDIQEVEPLYQAPLRVNEPCSASTNYGLIGTDCPVEQAVSGSPGVTNIDGTDYLVGMHTKGNPRSYESTSDSDRLNGYIQSSHFCEDYESVCGQPCAELDEVLPPPSNSVSL